MADKFLTEANIILEELIGTRAGSAEIDTVLFPTKDITDGEEIRIDEHLDVPTVFRVIKAGMPSNPNVVEAGRSLIDVPPTHAEKFQVTPEMTALAVAGISSTNHTSTIAARVTRQIRKLYEGWLSAKRKAAVGLLETGKLSLYDSSSASYDVYDFNREGDAKVTHDFNAHGSFDVAMAKAFTRARKYNMSPSNLALLCGKNWLTHFGTNEAIQKKALNNMSNVLIEQAMVKTNLANVEGLNVIARYNAAGVVSPIWILSYEPRLPFVSKKGAAPEPYVPDDKAILFSLDNSGYQFYRGVMVNTGYNSNARVAGELVQDVFTTPDPSITTYRMQSRFFFAMGNVNHAVTITGQNF